MSMATDNTEFARRAPVTGTTTLDQLLDHLNTMAEPGNEICIGVANALAAGVAYDLIRELVKHVPAEAFDPENAELECG